jgi:hypothetical protein
MVISGRGRNGGEPVDGAVYVVYGRDFTQTAGTIGTNGADTLTAIGSGAVVRGGAGDDSIRISSTDFFRLKGGSGHDTLQLTGAGMVLDFSALQANAVSEIERIDISGSGANTLEITMLQAMNITGTGRLLTIYGGADDTVDLENATIGLVGTTYTSYGYRGFEVQIHNDVTVNLVT